MEKNKFNRTQIYADNRRNKKNAMRIALSDFLCTSVSKKQFPIQLNYLPQSSQRSPRKFHSWVKAGFKALSFGFSRCSLCPLWRNNL